MLTPSMPPQTLISYTAELEDSGAESLVLATIRRRPAAGPSPPPASGHRSARGLRVMPVTNCTGTSRLPPLASDCAAGPQSVRCTHNPYGAP